MRVVIADASLVIPYEHERTTKGLMRKAKKESRMNRPLEELLYLGNHFMEHMNVYAGPAEFPDYVPPIPVIEAPAELRQYGRFIVYNGHHRLAAAKKADLAIPLILIETGRDLSYMPGTIEVLPDLLTAIMGDSIAKAQEVLCGMREINISLGRIKEVRI
ncbi:MAG: hypothetical protein KJ955_07390 [Nanoarchaeota archaeon]|nr:hypothetical protein [Nanoarchaeota archaeon]